MENTNLTEPYCGEEAIKAYAIALRELSVKSEADSSLKFLKVLLLRDEVARVSTAQLLLGPTLFSRLEELDHELQKQACSFDALIGRATLASWRETRQPPLGAWWWALDERTASKLSPLRTLVSILATSLTALLAAEITRRFLAGGADLAHIGIPLAQAGLAVVSGATLTQVGQERLASLLYDWKIPRKWHQFIKTILPLAILGLTICLYQSLPYIASRYANTYLNQQAVPMQQSGQLSAAIKSYERAVALAPDFSEAHYNLATAYEEIGDYDKAQASYQAALRANAQMYLAYNNLARLQLIQGKETDKALKLLNTALSLKPTEVRVQYSLYKNRGWTQFVLKNYTLAAEDLEQALKLRAEGAAAHCLLAHVREAQEQKAKAQPHWQDCEAYKTGQEHEIEPSWLSLAQERLRKGDIK